MRLFYAAVRHCLSVSLSSPRLMPLPFIDDRAAAESADVAAYYAMPRRHAYVTPTRCAPP